MVDRSDCPWAPTSFLGGLAPEIRRQLFAMGVPRHFRDGHRLLTEGARGTHVELLLRGFVKVTAFVASVETLLDIRVPGDILGETAAVTGRPRMTTVTTCGRVSSMVVTQPNFRAFLRRYPDAAIQMVATLGERLRWANLRRADFAAFAADVRLARVLLELARACGRRTDAGLTIGVRLSQPELATMVGVAEATVQKAIRELRETGIIRTGYRQIAIVDVEALTLRAKGGGW